MSSSTEQFNEIYLNEPERVQISVYYNSPTWKADAWVHVDDTILIVRKIGSSRRSVRFALEAYLEALSDEA